MCKLKVCNCVQFWDDEAEISEGSNIIGIFPGEKYGTRSAINCCHYDSIHLHH